MTQVLQWPGLAIIGGGPAGLAAAETASAAGVEVLVFERKGSVARKFLLAGKGGLNLTHSEPREAFVARYAAAAPSVGEWLDRCSPQDLRDWLSGLGIGSYVGSSGRVFPTDGKAAPLLRAWLRRLRAAGVEFRVHHDWQGWTADGALRFGTPDGELHCTAVATLFALGGASWPQLGADGSWQPLFAARGLTVKPLQPSNCGFDCLWSTSFRQRFAGSPLKPVRALLPGLAPRQGELLITDYGVEGSLIYALSAALREAIAAEGKAVLKLDLLPSSAAPALRSRLLKADPKRSLSERLRRALGLDPLRIALLRECLPPAALNDPERIVDALHGLELCLLRPRPIAEAISSAGGLALDELDGGLMLRRSAGVFSAGEMLDWDAPTGGYLLSACIASGRVAGAAAAQWCLAQRGARPASPAGVLRETPPA